MIWLVTLAFIAGPARWELAHTYQRLITELGDSLPLLTSIIGLPVLGLGASTFLSIVVRVLFWGVIWVTPLILLIGVWKASTREVLSDWLLFGGALYAVLMTLFMALVIVSLLLPFGLL